MNQTVIQGMLYSAGECNNTIKNVHMYNYGYRIDVMFSFALGVSYPALISKISTICSPNCFWIHACTCPSSQYFLLPCIRCLISRLSLCHTEGILTITSCGLDSLPFLTRTKVTSHFVMQNHTVTFS